MTLITGVFFAGTLKLSYRIIPRDVIPGRHDLEPGSLLSPPDLVSSYLSCHLLGQREELWTAVCTAAQGNSYKDSHSRGVCGSVLHPLSRLVLHGWPLVVCESESVAEPWEAPEGGWVNI